LVVKAKTKENQKNKGIKTMSNNETFTYGIKVTADSSGAVTGFSAGVSRQKNLLQNWLI